MYSSTEEELVSARSDLQEWMKSLDEVFSEAGEEVEIESDAQSHELHLDPENIDEITKQYLRPSTTFYSGKPNLRTWTSFHIASVGMCTAKLSVQ